MTRRTSEARLAQDADGAGYLPIGGRLAYPLQRVVQHSWFTSQCWKDTRPFSRVHLERFDS